MEIIEAIIGLLYYPGLVVGAIIGASIGAALSYLLFAEFSITMISIFTLVFGYAIAAFLHWPDNGE